MATLTAEGDELVVGLSAWEKLAAMRGDVRVPLAAAESIAVDPDPWSALRGVRAPGTGWPGAIAYGVRRATGGRPDFAALRGKAPAIKVELAGAAFGRLVVSVPDPQASVAAIEAALVRVARA
jgi:hypothetical protein